MDAHEFTLHIESMAYGGSGIGRRHDGKVVFVPQVLPGETVSAETTREHRSYCEARLKEILVASPRRIPAPCPLFSECGGCDWQHVEYPEQVRLKQEILSAQIRSKFPAHEIRFMDAVFSPNQFEYRCHTFVRCSYSRGFETGFFKRQSNSIIPFRKCLVLNDHCQAILDRMKRYISGKQLSNIDAIEIHAPGEDAIVRLHLNKIPSQDDLAVLEDAQRSMGLPGLSVYSAHAPGQERVFGRRNCPYTLTVQGRNIAFESVMGGFIQANVGMNQLLVSYVAECAQRSKSILDLYSGSGNFGIPLSFCAHEVLAVEQDAELVRSGADLVRLNGCTNIRFLNEKSSRAVKWLNSQGASFDAVILDPPREGAKDVMPEIARMKPEKIVYISCNPSTLARDCSYLAKEGFTIESVRLFDMFPQTFHIESVTVLRR